jgi:hypothetical protein
MQIYCTLQALHRAFGRFDRENLSLQSESPGRLKAAILSFEQRYGMREATFISGGAPGCLMHLSEQVTRFEVLRCLLRAPPCAGCLCRLLERSKEVALHAEDSRKKHPVLLSSSFQSFQLS